MDQHKIPNIIFAGNRDISLWILKFILKEGITPKCILIDNPKTSQHAKKITELCPKITEENILIGEEFKSKKGIKNIRNSKPDYIISIHFPHIFPKQIIQIPTHGIINLHPSYLPFNKGWHTPSWAIWEKTTFGATLHFIDENLDHGPIISQKELQVLPSDTADILYKKVKKLEFDLFKKTWPYLRSFNYKIMKQSETGTIHTRKDLPKIQKIDLNKKITAEELIRKLRALTTNNINEAAYFYKNNKKYRLQISVHEDNV